MPSATVIYHYTTISGLIGIMTNRKLWASDCRYLNDGAELLYAYKFFLTELEKLKLPPIDDGGYSVPSSVFEDFRMFISCFCENGDLLSQWLGYGANQGYSLGFDLKELRALNKCEIIPVQYGILNPSKYFKKELAEAPIISNHPAIYAWHASSRILPKLASVKNPAFSEEHEWRLLKKLSVEELKRPNIDLKFRPSKMGPISYLEIDFPAKCLREIIIGPGGDTDSQRIAVSNIINYYDLHDVKIRTSNIPLRR
jgi:hypothetical protein